MTQAYKVCPQCQEPAAIAAASCARCGRVYRTTAPAVQPTQVFPSPVGANPGRKAAVRIAGCVISIPFLFVLFLLTVGILNPGHRIPPGPHTMELLRRMKPYDLGKTDALLNAFGPPDQVFPMHAFDADWIIYNYRCADGLVSITGGERIRIVARIDAEGLDTETH